MSILSSQFSGALKNSFCCRLPPRLIARGLTMDSAKTTAGIIIIGDEILKGETQDTNSYFLTRKLRDLGVEVDRISIISDQVPIIAEEVLSFSQRYNYVLTSGGIGPTHDDVTFEGIAAAFGDKLCLNQELEKKCRVWFKTDDLSAPCFKLATLPSTANLNYATDKRSGKPMVYPLISVKNVYIFPGIPQLLEQAFVNIGPILFKSDVRFITGEVFINVDELSLTKRINALVQQFPDATFGSYPRRNNQYYQTRISIQANSQQQLQEIRGYISSSMDVIEYDSQPEENSLAKIHKFLDESKDPVFKTNLKTALDVIKECFQRYTPEEVSVCYNGGKDCIVMLHLVHAYLKELHPDKQLKSLYIQEDKTFPEVDDFIIESVRSYKLINRTMNNSMKESLRIFLDENPEMKAMALGVRNGDPGASSQNHFSPTDGDWPKLMRVNPIIQWRYQDVWTFLRGLSIPYPSLYDNGYTSLGNPDNTKPNPALRLNDEEDKYNPAYMLEDGSLERMGRSKK